MHLIYENQKIAPGKFAARLLLAKKEGDPEPLELLREERSSAHRVEQKLVEWRERYATFTEGL